MIGSVLAVESPAVESPAVETLLVESLLVETLVVECLVAAVGRQPYLLPAASWPQTFQDCFTASAEPFA